MRNCLVGISGSFSSNWRKFSSSCLSCFGSPKNDERTESRVNIPNNDDQVTKISATMVFVSQLPISDELDPNSVPLKISQKDLMPTPETHNLNPKTQTLELESAIEQNDLHSKSEITEPQTPELINDDIIKQQNTRIRLLEQLSVLHEMQTNELQFVVGNLSTRMDQLEALQQKENLQSRLNSENLQDSSSQWGGEGYKMLSPLIYRGSLAIEGLQDISDGAILQSTSQIESYSQIESSPRVESSSAPQTESSLSRILNINIFSDIDYTEKGDEKISELLKSLSDASDPNFSSIMAKMGNDLKGVDIDDVSFSPSSSPYNSFDSSNKNFQPKVLNTKSVKNESLLRSQYLLC